MNPVIPAARDHVGEFAPKISQYTIDPEKISEVIGKQGKTINGIIDETGVKIDIDESGRIDILSEDQAMIDKAISIIKSIVEPLNVGDIYEGEVGKDYELRCICTAFSKQRRNDPHFKTF